MIRRLNDFFILDTKNTTYCFRVMETGHLEHLYYGASIEIESKKDAACLVEQHLCQPGSTVIYNPAHKNFSLEDIRLEMSSYGKGDIREPFVEIQYADGSSTSDFVYDYRAIHQGKHALKNLPSAYATEESSVWELVIGLKDRNSGIKLELYYSVFEECDVIIRSCKIINDSSSYVVLKRLMSLQLDFSDKEYVVSSFGGHWAREMQKTDHKISAGKHVISSVTGTSSSRANPFFMLSREQTTEEYGDCYGFNLIYSGNHYESIEVSGFGKTRVTTGINPQYFEFQLKPGDSLESPEAVMCYSDAGFGGMSLKMHQFVREHIVRGTWKKKARPVLLNSWEANYFDISEQKLLRLAKKAKDVGIELMVMDDGWFGERNNDTSSLGDWTPNKKKLPDGIKGICDKINALGLAFGIWIEPEMVNVNSDLYRSHPDWALGIPRKAHSEGRNQRILDLTNPQVVEYITDQITAVLSSANITYVKWDMNRIFSDYYAPSLPAERQGEVAHCYVIGLYHMMKTLTERFPDILFEGCSAGGNRFDLGILCYCPQIWASDNTDARTRVQIQSGYSYGYPASCITAHVSGCPNHQTLRITPFDTRFHVAAFGVCGYELNVCDCREEELDKMKEQILFYKEHRELLQFGDFYRGRTGNLVEWNCVAPDKSEAIGMLFQELCEPNSPNEIFYPTGLDAKKRYHFTNRPIQHNLMEFGDLVNQVAPVHIKPNSLPHRILASRITMPSETEDYTTYGSTLMRAGVHLKQAFCCTGYEQEIRMFSDFASRLYVMKTV